MQRYKHSHQPDSHVQLSAFEDAALQLRCTAPLHSSVDGRGRANVIFTKKVSEFVTDVFFHILNHWWLCNNVVGTSWDHTAMTCKDNITNLKSIRSHPSSGLFTSLETDSNFNLPPNKSTNWTKWKAERERERESPGDALACLCSAQTTKMRGINCYLYLTCCMLCCFQSF